MGGLIVYLIFGGILAWPFTRILPQVGLNAWFALAVFVPFGVVVLLYVVALRITQ